MLIKEHPKGLFLCFSLETWERFGFYGVRALLVLFMTKALMFSTQKAGTVYGYYLGFVYLTPLLGGYIADKFWGRNKAIIIGSLIMALGQFMLAGVAFMNPEVVNDKFIWLFYLSLIIIILGGGFVKSNIFTVVGAMYEKNDPRRDSAYTIFYMGINLGAFLAPIVCGFLGERVGWGWGFGTAATFMMIGIIHYMMFCKTQLPESVQHPASRDKHGTKINHEPLTKEEKQKLAVIFIMAFFNIFFWAAMGQAGSSLTLFAEHSTARYISLLAWQVPTSWFQSLNPIFIVALAPLFSSLWVNLAKKQMEPSVIYKFVWGLVLASLSFLLMVLAVMVYEVSGPVSMLWLVAVYLIQTVGELCLAPIGFSLISKLSPVKFASFIMGLWFTSLFVANLASGLFAGKYDSMNHKTFFMVPVVTAGIAAILLLLLAKPIKKWMHGVK